MTRRRVVDKTWRQGAAIVSALVVLAGCDATEEPRQGSGMNRSGESTAGLARKNVDGTERSELEPVSKRLPGLPTPESLSWMSGTLGDARVPGPSTYWIDAVVTLGRADSDRLLALATNASPRQQDLAGALAARVPTGEWRSSPALNAALDPVPGWSVRAYRVVGTPVLIVMAIGES